MNKKSIELKQLNIGLNDLKEIRENNGQPVLITKEDWKIWIHPQILEDMYQMSKRYSTTSQRLFRIAKAIDSDINEEIKELENDIKHLDFESRDLEGIEFDRQYKKIVELKKDLMNLKKKKLRKV